MEAEKFIDSKKVEDYEVWTDEGWVDIQEVHKTVPFDVWRIETSNFFLECADEHIVIGEDGIEIYVKDLKVGDGIITENGIEKVNSVVKLDCPPENMYDLSIDSENHTFYTNGILSHNSTLATIFALWICCFSSDQSMLIVANKEDTAISIFSRIRLAYELLPNYLKPGVKEWGKTGMALANGSSIKVSTTSSTAARGQSINCLFIDEAAHIECLHGESVVKLRDVFTKKEYEKKIGEMFKFNTNVSGIENDLICYETNENLEVWTDCGWSDFKGVSKYDKKKLVKVLLGCGKNIIVSEKHGFILESGDIIHAVNSLGSNIITENGIDKVISVEEIDDEDYVYDIVDVEKNHRYYANGILNHNTHLLDDFWKSVIPTISSGKKSKIFMVSTPNGIGNKFYEMYNGAEKGDNGWNNERIDWWDVPGRNEKWKNDMVNTLGSEESFSQEFGNVFLDSATAAVGYDVLEAFKVNKKAPIWKSDDGSYRVYEMPKKDNLYVVGCDVGEGVGRASSTAQVLDVTDLSNITQVAVYGSNTIEPYHFANRLINLCSSWGNPPLLIERNNCGAQTLDALSHELSYEKLVSYSKLTQTGEYKSTKNLGIFSHNNLRFNAVSNLRYWINFLQVVKIYDSQTISELETFIRYPNGTYRKKGEKFFDDYVMGLVWGLFTLDPDVCQQYFNIEETDEQQKPLKITRGEYFPNDESLYELKDLIGGNVVIPSNEKVQKKYEPLLGNLDIYGEDDLNMEDLTDLGYTIFRP